MTDPRRLLDGAGSNLECELLASGCDERPDPLAKQRAAAALMIGAAAAASAWPVAAAATAAKASKAGIPLIAKLLAIGAVSAGTLGTVQYLQSSSEPARPSETAIVSSRSTERSASKGEHKAQESAEPITQVEALEVEVPSEPVKQAPASRSSAETASISDEMRMLDEARRALSGGDGASSIRALDAYRRQFPRGAFSQEAVLLRIQALTQVGDHAAAKALAQRFKERHPNSPHLRRIESVLGGK